jgi:hypothetical protein
MTSPSTSTRLWQAASTSPAAAGICCESLTNSRAGLQAVQRMHSSAMSSN